MDKPKILIAEDEKALLDLYKLRFEYESCSVLFAQNGEEALNLAKKEKPDLILLDVMMPKKSGMEVLKELKNDSSTSKIPVIVLTALFQENIKEEALKIGANDYLVKSHSSPSEVVRVVKEKLGLE